MIRAGIDVVKDKHDCFIIFSEIEIMTDVFSIPNNSEGFEALPKTIRGCSHLEHTIKVGPEATGHHSYNILGFSLGKCLHTNLYQKSLSLRKTKTDRFDARTIAAIPMPNLNLKSYADAAHHNKKLKLPTRHSFEKTKSV